MKDLEKAFEKYAKTKWEIDCPKVMDEYSSNEDTFIEGVRWGSSHYKKILKDLYMQSYGIKNHWAGIWYNCSECGHMYASGGNWNDGQSCPFCEAKKLINY